MSTPQEEVPAATLPELILEDLRWRADQAIINYEGESVWLEQMPGYITDCCYTDAPCERHRSME